MSRLFDLVSLCDFLNLETPRPILFQDVTRLLEGTLSDWDRPEDPRVR